MRLLTAFHPIPPSKVVDPRPGPAKPSEDGTQSPNSFQDLHIPVKMMEDFLRLAQQNTKKNLETCGVLAGSLIQKNRVFYITSLIIPMQESTSDSLFKISEDVVIDATNKGNIARLINHSVLFHFLSNLLRLKELGLHGVITLIELGAHFFYLLVRYRILAPVSILL
ncbi:AMSH-like ubiquitin thioesterase 3 isoform X1 [Beta vulgaris subsp. vulgaris]|uniref:AMSH-like ubiquitin thioesterase 3 isoform X1 n=1 Tax=Beta vulgaris subsp. vulgaris TaxID=3555 RepID=UPI002036F81B|nr:AMSH-like ubiquitin thioesterase 3 isoform X1 [Beta vulgaris subsp. vulgaris]XP_048494288.1 AMSH-like ubiquitin thioesterase 3 isoform X1 [Beta vulgaris subsp. vulgaris]XP_048494289.1 AMSH-like ubiquitin thioesterase 3 isoform X1 [Beta vulgaris subsp. vulgaris]XP_048494290.1 AMSH-like ubiquitin thioesterase 3 isoform X1 [Beta vulgaris subsp. vulgaris]